MLAVEIYKFKEKAASEDKKDALKLIKRLKNPWTTKSIHKIYDTEVSYIDTEVIFLEIM